MIQMSVDESEDVPRLGGEGESSNSANPNGTCTRKSGRSERGISERITGNEIMKLWWTQTNTLSETYDSQNESSVISFKSLQK